MKTTTVAVAEAPDMQKKSEIKSIKRASKMSNVVNELKMFLSNCTWVDLLETDGIAKIETNLNLDEMLLPAYLKYFKIKI